MAAFIPYPSTPECLVASEWAFANRDRLPTTLRAFREHSASERRAIYRELSDADRRNLWRAHIQYVLDAGLELTQQQRLELDLIVLRIDEYVGNPILGRRAHARDSLDSRIRDTFDPRTAALLFASLGDEVAPKQAAREDRNNYPNCSCSTSSSFCMILVCTYGGWADEDCIPVPGCGLFWCYICDGACTNEAMEND